MTSGKEIPTITAKVATAGWAYAAWRTMSESASHYDSYALGFGSELFLPLMVGTFARLGTTLLSRGHHAKHVAHIAALAYLGYEMDFNTVTIDDAVQYFGGDPEWFIEKSTNPILFPIMASLYGAGYFASTGGQVAWNTYRSHLEQRG